MERNVNNRFQLGLIIFLLMLAVGMGIIIFWLLRERDASQPVPQAALVEPSQPAAATTVATPSRDTSAASATAASLPTPTFVPVNPANAGSAAPPATTEPAPPVPQPTRAAPPQPLAPTSAPVPVRVDGTTVRLDDDTWRGGYRSARGYGGRSATWIYGTNTQYSSMRAAFVLDERPTGATRLVIEGMDSEDRPKTPILITVNDVEIFNGPNPLPNDDLPLETGTWDSAAFPFDPGLLRAGQNTIQITNLKPGAFSLPPFFMLDYALVTLE